MSLECLSPFALLARPPPSHVSHPAPAHEAPPFEIAPLLPHPRGHVDTARHRSLPIEPVRPPVQIPIGFGRAHTTSQPALSLRQPVAELDFDKVCLDASVTVNPRRLGFVPASAWSNDAVPFGVLVATFFRKRNSMHCKFPFKLYNALKLTQQCPEFLAHVGVEWVTDSVFRVHRTEFARLLGVKTVEGGLFHQQGNFPSHGFVELPFDESDRISREAGLGPADLSQVRFMRHAAGNFVRQSTERDLETCRWNGK